MVSLIQLTLVVDTILRIRWIQHHQDTHCSVIGFYDTILIMSKTRYLASWRLRCVFVVGLLLVVPISFFFSFNFTCFTPFLFRRKKKDFIPTSAQEIFNFHVHSNNKYFNGPVSKLRHYDQVLSNNNKKNSRHERHVIQMVFFIHQRLEPGYLHNIDDFIKTNGRS